MSEEIFEPTEPIAPGEPQAEPQVEVKESPYKDKGWYAKVVNEKGEVDTEKALKQIDNLEGLVGKKVNAFKFAEADETAINEFWQQQGVADHTAYNLEAVPEDNREVIQKMLFESKIPPQLAQPMVEKYLAYEQEQLAQHYSADGLKESFKEFLGENYEPKAEAVKNLIKSSNNPDITAFIDEAFPNRMIGVMYKVVYDIIEKYGANESGVALGKTSSVNSTQDLQTALNESRAKLESYKNNMNVSEEVRSAELKRYIELNNKVGKLGGVR